MTKRKQESMDNDTRILPPRRKLSRGRKAELAAIVLAFVGIVLYLWLR
ncbi:MAG: hypothetical protein LUF87_10015 [Alistipes sp.]|nr:hypothetical protein [Alistipes sp.]